MWRVLKFLITGDWHLHKWIVIETAPCSGEDGRWTRRYCQCEHCGTIKVFDV